METQRLEEWSRRYIEKYSLYQEFTRRIKNLVQDLIDREDALVYSIEGHTKSPGAFLKEISQAGTAIADPFRDLNDLSCIRILLYFPGDVKMVEQVVQEEFLIDLPHSTTSVDLEDPDLFGYRSIYYGVSLKSDRAQLKEWEKYRDLRALIQVRTVLQEAWASISPQIATATDVVAKKKLKRKLSRVSALLEEADEDFHYLREAAREFSIPVAGGNTHLLESAEKPEDAVLNGDSMTAFFKGHPDVLKKWSDAAMSAGFPRFVASSEYEGESMDYLLNILFAADIDTISGLEAFLNELDSGSVGTDQLETIYQAFEKEASSWRVDGYSALFLLVLNTKWDVLQHKDLIRLGVKAGSDRIKGGPEAN